MLSTEDVIDGKYRILGLLGEGGMGVVYAGENMAIRRRVAIKLLHASFAGDREAITRFEREAQAAGCIGSDHVLEVLDIGALPNGQRYIVMELLEGESLGQRLAHTPRLTVPAAISIFRQLLTGLEAAHSAGIVHRDLKPDNVFILRHKADQDDFVKIIDFGISKYQYLDEHNTQLTQTGVMMGTPLYMAPELATGDQEADARSDIYAVGVMLYECLSGEVPFPARAFDELLFQIVLGQSRPLEERIDIDPALSQIVAKAMAKEPLARYPCCADMRAALEHWQLTRDMRAEAHPVSIRLGPPSMPNVPNVPNEPLSIDSVVSFTPGGMSTPNPLAGYFTPRGGFAEVEPAPAPTSASTVSTGAISGRDVRTTLHSAQLMARRSRWTIAWVALVTSGAAALIFSRVFLGPWTYPDDPAAIRSSAGSGPWTEAPGRGSATSQRPAATSPTQQRRTSQVGSAVPTGLTAHAPPGPAIGAGAGTSAGMGSTVAAGLWTTGLSGSLAGSLAGSLSGSPSGAVHTPWNAPGPLHPPPRNGRPPPAPNRPPAAPSANTPSVPDIFGY